MSGTLTAWLARARLGAALFAPATRGQPLKITAIVTERCHLRCAFCRLWEQPVDGASSPEWRAFFAANPFLRWVNLSGGELFAKESGAALRELLLGIVESLPRLELLDFPTAGQRPDEVVAAVDALLSSRLPQLAVTVSLDGGPTLHDELRGVAGAFERAFDCFAQLRRKRSARLVVVAGCTLTDRAEEQAESLAAELARRLPDFDRRELHFNLAHHSSHYYRNAGFAGLPGQSALDVLGRWPKPSGPLGFLERHYARLAPRALRDGHPPIGCEALRRTVFVGPDLDVHPCTIWEQPLGNARDFGLSLERLLTAVPARVARATIAKRACPGCFSPCEALPALAARPFATAFART
ncbi:MAG: radical SAM protein [Planctomycetes bacterium]|nr:radical SAM protein [Planctomycetota bacterium]